MLLSSAVVDGDPVAAATAVALRHSTVEGPGISRRRSGQTFRYRLDDGKPLRDRATLSRIRALAIPLPRATPDVLLLRTITPLVARFVDAPRGRRRA
jgi:DNA topoisomerase IB